MLKKLHLVLAICALALPYADQALAQDLLFSDADVPAILDNAARPLFSDFWSETLEADADDDANFYREAFIYKVTGDAERGETAKQLLLEKVAEEYWNNFADGDERLGFLRAGRLTSWASLAYDWLGDLLTEEERASVREAIAEKGCVPLWRALYGFKYPESVTEWKYAPYAPPHPRNNDIDRSRWPHILAHNNFRAIINGGLTLGTIVLEGHDERASEWKEIVLESIQLFNALLKDDGSYDEAVAYLNYAMIYQIYAMEAARRQWDIDFFDSANFHGMVDYNLAMYMPSTLDTHGSVTFGDAGGSLRSSILFWVARQSRDGVAQHSGIHFADHNLFSLVYFDPSIEEIAPTRETNLVELDLDWIISRSGYDIDDFVLALRSGGPMNHEHADRNSIQLKAFGEILLADLARPTYWPDDPEWAWRGPLGHNLVLIDGRGPQYHEGQEGTNESKSHAKIVRAGERADYHFWASDATHAYQLDNPDVVSVTRTVLSFPEIPAAVVADKVIVDGEPATVSARWHAENMDGQAGVEAHQKGFVISRPGARLVASAAATTGLKNSVGRFDSDRRDHPFIYLDAVGSRRANSSFLLTVLVPARVDEPDPGIRIDRSDDEWKVEFDRGGEIRTVSLTDRGTLPEFSVSD